MLSSIIVCCVFLSRLAVAAAGRFGAALPGSNQLVAQIDAAETGALPGQAPGCE